MVGDGVGDVADGSVGSVVVVGSLIGDMVEPVVELLLLGLFSVDDVVSPVRLVPRLRLRLDDVVVDGVDADGMLVEGEVVDWPPLDCQPPVLVDVLPVDVLPVDVPPDWVVVGVEVVDWPPAVCARAAPGRTRAAAAIKWIGFMGYSPRVLLLPINNRRHGGKFIGPTCVSLVSSMICAWIGQYDLEIT